MLICKDCGTRINDENFRFCPKCGGQNLQSDQWQNSQSNTEQYLKIDDMLNIIYNYVGKYIFTQEFIDLVGLGVQQKKGFLGSVFGPSKNDIENRKVFFRYFSFALFSGVVIHRICLMVPSLTERTRDAIIDGLPIFFVSATFKQEAVFRPEVKKIARDMRDGIKRFVNVGDDDLEQEIFSYMIDLLGLTVEKFGQFYKGHKQILSMIQADFPNFYNQNIAGKIIQQ